MSLVKYLEKETEKHINIDVLGYLVWDPLPPNKTIDNNSAKNNGTQQEIDPS